MIWSVAHGLLANPVVAVLLGAVLGAAFLVLSHRSFSRMTPESGPAGLAVVGVLLFTRMGAAALLILAYWRWVHEGFLAFAVAFAAAFFIGYMIELYRYGGSALMSARGR
jgi:hypothetical protein